MEMSFTCPECGKTYSMPTTSLAGKRARCKQCKCEFVIPIPAAPDESDDSYDSEPVYEVRPRHRSRPPAPRLPAIQAPRPVPPEDSRRLPPVQHPYQYQQRPVADDPNNDNPQGLLIAIVLGGFGVVVLMIVGIGLTAFRGSGNAVETVAVADRPRNAPAPAGNPAAAAAAPNPAPFLQPRAAAPKADVPRGPTLNTADLVARCEPSVALIMGKRGFGTGFLVRPRVIATNSHVIESESIPAIEVNFPSAEESKRGPYKAVLIYQDKFRDLAFLGVETDLPALPIAESYSFRKGEDVTVIGNPGLGGVMRLENAISKGIVSSKTKLDGRDFLQLGIAINPGNSGGPVFDETGQVIGVVTLKTKKQEGLAFCVPVEDLCAALALAESSAGQVIVKEDTSPTRRQAGPDLRYDWKPNKSYVYSVEMTVTIPEGVVIFQGQSHYRVKSLDGDEILLGQRGSLNISGRTRDGRPIPIPADRAFVGGNQENDMRVDPKGNILALSASESLGMLGQLASAVIEPFPDDFEPAWTMTRAVSWKRKYEIEGANRNSGVGFGNFAQGPSFAPRLGPGMSRNRASSARDRMRSGRLRGPSLNRGPTALQQRQQQEPNQVVVKEYPSQEQTEFTIRPPEGDLAVISKKYQMATDEMFGNEPVMKIAGDGTFKFDTKAGIPVSVDFRANMTTVENGGRVIVPVELKCRLISAR